MERQGGWLRGDRGDQFDLLGVDMRIPGGLNLELELGQTGHALGLELELE